MIKILQNIVGLEWVGSISLEDADVLAEMASKCTSILEYGSGGSSLIFAQCLPKEGKLLCLETKDKWERLTRERLSIVKRDTAKVEFFPSRKVEDITLLSTLNLRFDLIFIDGQSGFKNNLNLRADFSLHSWSLLRPGGQMLFHDTKRPEYASEMFPLIRKENLNIQSVSFNVVASNGIHSNISLIKKRDMKLNPDNFQSKEDTRELWTFGGSEHQDFIMKNGLYCYKGES